MLEEIKKSIPAYGANATIDEIAESLSKIKGMEIYDKESINEWARYFSDCGDTLDQCIIDQKFDGKKIHVNFS